MNINLTKPSGNFRPQLRIAVVLTCWIVVMLVTPKSLLAQPGWSVNSADFQFSMTVTAVLDINGVISADQNDLVAAFVNGQVRGVGSPTVFVASRNEYQVFMQVYGDAQGEQVTFQLYDQSANATISAVNQAIPFIIDGSYGAIDNPLVIRTNNSPTNVQLSNMSIVENSDINTNIGTFTTTDADVGDTHTYSIVSGEGATDNAKFTIAGNVLRNTEVFNFEVKNTYNIRVRTTDQKNGFFEKAFTINVTDVNEVPTNILLSNSAIDENKPAGTVIGQLTAVDEDFNENHTFTLSGTGGQGADNASFAIMGNQLRSAVVFDFETKATYAVQVQVQDAGGLTFLKQLTISINDVNDPPTALNLSNNQVEENRSIGTEIGTFTTEDQDANEVFTYSFYNPQNTNDNNKFTISGNKLRTNEVFDFESKSSYIIYVQVTDKGGAVLQQSLTLEILDVNEAPNSLAISSTSVSENEPTETLVGTFSTTDPDGDTDFTYTLTAGAGDVNNASFAIDGDKLRTAMAFDYEAKSSFLIRVRVSDAGGLFFDKNFTISIVDVNDAPTDINLSSNTISENREKGTLVGTITAIDQDKTDTHIFSLVAGTGSDDNASFKIIGSTLQSDNVFNFEEKSQYTVRIKADDSRGGVFEKEFVIQILDENDPPSGISLDNNSIEENAPVGTLIGNLATQDEDADDTHTYLLEQFGDHAQFQISGDKLLSRVSFDFETRSNYSIRIRSTDQGGAFFIADYTVEIIDVNEAPTDIVLSQTSINENEPIGTRVGFLSMIDPDANESATFSLVTGFNSDGNQFFDISGNSLSTNGQFDYEEQPSYTIRVEVEDKEGLKFIKWFAITIADVNDAPEDITLSPSSIGENQPVSTTVGLLSTVDQDKDDTHSYTLVSGEDDEDNNAFKISGSELQSNAIFNYEVRDSYNIRVRTTDREGDFFEKSFLIAIEDRNDLPTDLLLGNTTIEENKPVGTVVGSMSTVDEDQNDTYKYTIESHADGGLFYTDGDLLKSKVVFDFEARDTYAIRVRSTDQGNLSVTRDFVITVIDTNDLPSDILLSNNSLEENLPEGSIVGELSAIDQDANGTFTYTLVQGAGSTDNAAFSIEGDELRSNIVFDFEKKNRYTVRIQVTDASGGTFSKPFVVNINDVNDQPTDIQLSSHTIGENLPSGTFIGRFSAVDQDIQDAHTFALAQGSGDQDNSSFRIVGNELQSDKTFDFEVKSSYSIRVRTMDLAGTFFEKVFEIIILDRNDPPTDLFFVDTPSILAGSTIGSFVGRLAVVDQDAVDNHRFELFGGLDGVHNNLFRIEGNELLTNAEIAEQPSRLNIAIRVTDKGNENLIKSFVVNVIPSNRPPIAENQLFEVMEDAQLGESVVTLQATDPDMGQMLEFTLLNQASLGQTFPFTLQSDGNLLVSNPEFLDILWHEQWQLEVRATDNGIPNLSVDFRVTLNLVHVPGNSLPFNNYVSPNGDNKNDFLVIEHIEKYPNNSIAIYDNAGREVFATRNYQNDWDGHLNGKLLPSGSYVMVFTNESTGKVYRTSFTLITK